MSTKSPVNYDGRTRTALQELDINTAFARCFDSIDGQSVLSYLRRITIESVSGPGVEVNALLHLEGQRYLVGLMQSRVNDGKEGKPNVPITKPK